MAAKKSVTWRTRAGTNRRFGQSRLIFLTSLMNSSRIEMHQDGRVTQQREPWRRGQFQHPARTTVRIVSTLLDQRFARTATLNRPSRPTTGQFIASVRLPYKNTRGNFLNELGRALCDPMPLETAIREAITERDAAATDSLRARWPSSQATRGRHMH
jgi:hypothetical protein